MQTVPEPMKLGRFGTGFKRPVVAIRWLLSDKKSWPLALMPTLIFSFLSTIALWVSPDIAEWVLELIWQEPRGRGFFVEWIVHPLWTLCWFVFLLLSAIVGIMVGFLLSVPLAGPFLEMLCERQEDPEDRIDTKFSWRRAFASAAFSLGHLALFLSIELGLLLVCMGIGLIPLIGPPMAALLSGTISVFVLGIGLLDYPMTLRVWSFKEKIRFARQSRGEFLGFALCGFVMLYVPILNLLTLPVCVLGANAMIRDWEAQGQIHWTDRRRQSIPINT